VQKVSQAKKAHPARIVAGVFGLAISVGTLVLSLPVSRTANNFGGFLEAAFTSVSAVCVTGLSTVDVSTYWTPFGHLMIMLMIKLGGLGIVTFAVFLGILLIRRVGLNSRMLGNAEIPGLDTGDPKKLVLKIVLFAAAFEFLTATFVALRLWLGYGYELSAAIWEAVFHAIGAFNHAGFALHSDSMVRFATDPWILMPLNFAVVAGSLGFPVLIELLRRASGRVKASQLGGAIESALHWTLATRLVLWSSFILLIFGTLYVALIEWFNPLTLGPMADGSKIMNALTLSVMARSGGFNTFDIGDSYPATLMGVDLLMFIGGGSASTAGGIKLTTAAVLIFIVWTEIRGETAVNVGSRRLPRSIQRQALTIISLASLAVIVSTILISLTTKFSTDEIFFEVVSAFGTVGLSTGITPDMPPLGQIILMALMFGGRLGLVVVATALAVRQTKVHFEYPKERPLIG
jgi:Trk-type K+ transport system membrane component